MLYLMTELASFPGSFFPHRLFYYVRKKLGREPGNEAMIEPLLNYTQLLYFFGLILSKVAGTRVRVVKC